MGPVSKQSKLYAFGTWNADAPNLPLMKHKLPKIENACVPSDASVCISNPF